MTILIDIMIGSYVIKNSRVPNPKRNTKISLMRLFVMFFRKWMPLRNRNMRAENIFNKCSYIRDCYVGY